MMEQASQDLKFDEIGYWSEIKLDIVKKYAAAYTTILARQECLSFSYVDGFAGNRCPHNQGVWRLCRRQSLKRAQGRSAVQ